MPKALCPVCRSSVQCFILKEIDVQAASGVGLSRSASQEMERLLDAEE